MGVADTWSTSLTHRDMYPAAGKGMLYLYAHLSVA
jgi:hypothetical protein